MVMTPVSTQAAISQPVLPRSRDISDETMKMPEPIMVPATMCLAGDLNWKMPAWLKRIVPELREGPVGDVAPAAGTAAKAVGDGERIALEQRTTE